MAILLNNHGYDNRSWFDALTAHLPDRPIHVYPDVDDLDSIRDDIEFAVVWDHPHGDLVRYPNLKGILLLGAGTEAIDTEIELPDVPVARLVDPEVLGDMALTALYWTIHFHRHHEQYRRQQLDRHWERHATSATSEFHVTVLGLGMVGREVAGRLATNGFRTSGWDLIERELDDVTCFAGHDALSAALGSADVLVNCLPLSPDTEGFIGADLLARLPAGAHVVNISRGGVVDDEALLAALDSRRVAHAALDVFAVEPLPDDSPYWTHPHVSVTPHMSGATYARSAARLVAANIARIEAGADPIPKHVPTALR
ncbi:MAG: glyoxylate/hydroxypyruvate reductase A [Actinomycetota bacterium]